MIAVEGAVRLQINGPNSLRMKNHMICAFRQPINVKKESDSAQQKNKNKTKTKTSFELSQQKKTHSIFQAPALPNEIPILRPAIDTDL